MKYSIYTRRWQPEQPAVAPARRRAGYVKQVDFERLGS